MSSKTELLNGLLKKGVPFEFTAEHEGVAGEALVRLTGPDVLAFPEPQGLNQVLECSV